MMIVLQPTHCDKFPASCPHFLSRLSEVIDAGVENPQGPFTILDNTESQRMARTGG